MMSKSEREDLQRLVRQREKVLKAAAGQRTAELVADFKNQMGQEFSFDQDEVWSSATKLADAEVQKAQATITARCRELGIPDRFAPRLSLGWVHRGYDNALASRRNELLGMAKAKVQALEAKALVDIGIECLDAQAKLASAGLTSEAAQAFLASLTPIEKLMPKLSFEAVAGKAKPPIAEQLVSSTALRQRRFRERHRDVTGPLRPDRVTLLHPDGDAAPAGGDDRKADPAESET